MLPKLSNMPSDQTLRSLSSFFILITNFHMVFGKSLPLDIGDNTVQEHVKFLQKYGYLEESYTFDSLQKTHIFENALKFYQEYSGIPVTGRLDEETRIMMSQPRCGMKDFDDVLKHKTRKKRDFFKLIFGSFWNRRDLTYGISDSPKSLSKTSAENIISRALKLWGDSSQLTFTKSNDPMIDIKFLEGYHGDEFAFDGRGKVLAHAFYPGVFSGKEGGDIHFDNDEDWTDNTTNGKNLLQVALHESGHSLGLRHSQNPDAVMAPVYKGYDPNVQLHSDDIANLRELYGVNENQKLTTVTTDSTTFTTSTSSTFSSTSSTSSTSPSSSSSTSPSSALTSTLSSTTSSSSFSTSTTSSPVSCKNGKIDAIIKTERGDFWNFYVFQDRLIYSIRAGQIDTGYPKPISRVFSWLSGPINAAITWPEIRTWTSTCGDPSCYKLQLLPPVVYIFKWHLVYQYELSSAIPKYLGVHYLSSLFPGIRGKVDAGFYHHSSRFTYLFTDAYVYKISSRSSYFDQGGVIQNSWPRSTSDFDFPNSLGVYAAVQHYDRKMYLFFENTFYELNRTTWKIDKDQPKPIQPTWIPCNNQYIDKSIIGELVDRSSSISIFYSSYNILTIFNIIVLSCIYSFFEITVTMEI